MEMKKLVIADEKKGKSTRLAKTCLPGQPLDRSWTPEQLRTGANWDNLKNFEHFGSSNDFLNDSTMILHGFCSESSTNTLNIQKVTLWHKIQTVMPKRNPKAFSPIENFVGLAS